MASALATKPGKLFLAIQYQIFWTGDCDCHGSLLVERRASPAVAAVMRLLGPDAAHAAEADCLARCGRETCDSQART